MKSWPRPQPEIAATTAAAIVNARTAVMPALASGTRRLRRRGGGGAGAQALRLGGMAAARGPAQGPIDGGGGAPVAPRPPLLAQAGQHLDDRQVGLGAQDAARVLLAVTLPRTQRAPRIVQVLVLDRGHLVLRALRELAARARQAAIEGQRLARVARLSRPARRRQDLRRAGGGVAARLVGRRRGPRAGPARARRKARHALAGGPRVAL